MVLFAILFACDLWQSGMNVCYFGLLLIATINYKDNEL